MQDKYFFSIFKDISLLFYIKLQAQHRDILNATLANKKVSTKKGAH